MKQKLVSKHFTIECEDLYYALGLPHGTDIDWWHSKTDSMIWWDCEIFFNSEGINDIRGLVERFSTIITFRIHEGDLRSKDVVRLSSENMLYKTGDFYEGLLYVNTMTEKEWQVSFEVECENNVMMPTKVEIDFMDKHILIL